MFKSNLFDILKTLSAKEFKEFGEYVESPFFNKNESVIKLYNHIKKYYPELDNEKLEKEKAYRIIFPNVDYNDGFTRTIMFNLGKLAEDYLTYINFFNDQGNAGLHLLDELNTRKIDRIFSKKLKIIEDEIESTPYLGWKYYYEKHQLENIKNIFTNWRSFKNKNFKDYEDNSSLFSTDYLIQFFLIKILNAYRFFYNKKSYTELELDFEIVDEIVNYLKKDNPYKYNILINLYFTELLLLKEEDEQYYYSLKELLFKNADKLNWHDKYSTSNVLQNYCTIEYYNGKLNFLKERMELYKWIISRGLYSGLEGGYFDDLIFSNIVLVGSKLKEHEWIMNFIDKYKSKLAPESMEITYNYNLARAHFAQGNFEQALKDLNRIKRISHVQYKIIIKNITMMIYYELSYFDMAHGVIDSYRHFLSNDRSISELRKVRYLNFINFFNRLLRLKEKNNKKELENLSFDLTQVSNVIEKDWMMEKIEEMKKNN